MKKWSVCLIYFFMKTAVGKIAHFLFLNRLIHMVFLLIIKSHTSYFDKLDGKKNMVMKRVTLNHQCCMFIAIII